MFTRILLQTIPFIHTNHQRAPRLQYKTSNVCILLRDVLLCIEQQQNNIRIGNRLQRFDHREFLDRFEYLTLTTYTRSVDQGIVTTIALERNLDRITRSTWHIECNHALFAE